MFSPRARARKAHRDDAEKPFWISFSDLMTALMVLFLVVMGVALLAVTQKPPPPPPPGGGIEGCMDQLAQVANSHPGVRVNKERRAIDFGERAQFAFGDWRLNSQQEEVLRKFVPEILTLANTACGPKILKRVVVEGYTDKTGSYLSNLNLSLQRSQKVLCTMFATSGPSLLSDAQKEQVRALFFVGGYSFNAAKDTDEESRRVEMRLEFLGLDEVRETPPAHAGNFGDCALR